MIIGIAWCLTRLPTRTIGRIGKRLGDITYHLAKQRRHITQVNIAKCFPELSAEEQHALVRANFQQIGIGGLELMIPWLNPKRDLASRFTLHGVEHLRAAHAEGRGVILVGGHYATMDTISPALAQLDCIDVMYRFNKNPAWEWLQYNGRKRYFDGVIERDDTRGTLRRLKKGRVIWYATDQDYGPKHSVFAPFFGVEAATIVATSRFARMNNSPVLLMRQTRHPDMTWSITFSEVLEDFPSGDDALDAKRLNSLLEEQIRHHPEQYMWLHKRFKTRPPGEESFY